MRCTVCGGETIRKNGEEVCPYCGKKYGFSKENVVSINAKGVFKNNINSVGIVDNIDDNSSGTCFLIKKNLCLTNAHVISKDDDALSNNLMVYIGEGEYKAKIVKANPIEGNNDIAVIELLNFDKGVPVTFGNSDKVECGDEVISIGNSKGEGLSITKGIISDNARVLSGFHFFMSDVAVNPGNSGGPLFNEKGEVVAMAVLKRMDAEGMNYFIPINHVIKVLKDWKIL